jgi:two-component system, cell cycle response regulator DivK
MKSNKVLIVDDQVIFVETAAFALRATDCIVDCASDASQALLKIPVFQPDLILMDIQMPGMDGIELTRRLKADPATRHIVIVAFTSFAMKGDEAPLRAAGFDGYISKPLNMMTLSAEVHFWLDGPESARASPFMWP